MDLSNVEYEKFSECHLFVGENECEGYGIADAADELVELAGPLHDVEYAEGDTGADITAHLEAAGRALRAAFALVREE